MSKVMMEEKTDIYLSKVKTSEIVMDTVTTWMTQEARTESVTSFSVIHSL